MKEEKFCRHCGGKLDINTNRCLKCGKEQRDFLKKHPLFIPVVCVVLLICISIGIIFYGINSIHKNSDSAEYSKLDSLLGGLWDNISTTPEEIIQSYKDDFEESESKYSYTYLEITGKIQSIEENDKILKIQLQTDKKDDYKVYCYFDKEDNDEVYDELKNYKQGTEITAVGEFERKGKVLNINYCILGDWDTYYAFDNTFQIDVDLEDLIESAKKNDKSIALKKENIMSFDYDILDYSYSYEDILDNISEISGGEVEITDINEETGIINTTITMKINGKETSIEVEDGDSIFDENLVYQINKKLKENNSEKMFYCAVRKYEEDLDLINIAYSNESDITKINKVLNKSNLDITEFKKMQNQHQYKLYKLHGKISRGNNSKFYHVFMYRKKKFS